MLYLISIVNTMKIPIKDKQNKMRKESKDVSIKKLNDTQRKGRKEEHSNKVTIIHRENNYQNYNNKSFSISIFFKRKWITLPIEII